MVFGLKRSDRPKLLFAVLLIGSILRICFFWMDTSFWGDEAALRSI